VLRVPCTRDEVRLAAQRALRYQELATENRQLRQQLGHTVAANGNGAAAGVESVQNGDALATAAKELAGTPLADIEKQVILRTLEQFKGHRLRTAAALGIGVRPLGMKIKRWREEGEPIAGRHHGHQQQQAVHVDVS
jgi:transcriptional regulator with PAS, ATPase and Fis domain